MPRRENHRARLIQGALECLRVKGYARTTTRDIATAAKANLGSIGYHFGSKEVLLNEALREGFARWMHQLARAGFADPHASAPERLRATLTGLAETFQSQRPLMVGFVEAVAQAERSEELRTQLADIYEQARAAAAGLVEESIADHEIDSEHSRAIASVLIALCDGMLLQWLVDPERSPSGEALFAGVEVASTWSRAPRAGGRG